MTDVGDAAGLFRRTVESMAMPFEITVVRDDPEAIGGGGPDEADCASAVAAFHRDLEWVDSVFSLWRDDTPLTRLARGEISVEDCPPAVSEVFAECDRFREVTGGFFDHRRPDGVLDPTGIVKAWAVARAAWRLEALGAAGWMVGASGDVLTSGVGPDLGPWRVGVADPLRAADPQGAPVLDVVALGTGLDATFLALATSGTAQHGEHVWNPKTSRREAAFAQASVVGRDLVECDAWATAIVAGGREVALAAQRHGLEVLCLPPIPEGAERVVAESSPGWPSAIRR